MPTVSITLSAGRTREQKAVVAEAITDLLEQHLGCRRESVGVIFHDVENANWAIAGKLLDEPRPA